MKNDRHSCLIVTYHKAGGQSAPLFNQDMFVVSQSFDDLFVVMANGE